MRKRKVALIVVTYNRLSTLKSNLEFIRNQEQRPDYFLIVDNASEDGTVSFLQNQSEFCIICSDQNLGYGAGLARGIQFAIETWNPDYFWLMDDDSFPNPRVLSTLYNHAEDIELKGVLGISGYTLKKGIPRPIRSDKMIENADFVLVDNALVSKTAIQEIGNFRDDLFMMCEDYDFCIRLKKHGLFVGIVQDQNAIVERKHLGSQVNSKSIIWRGYYHSRNHLLVVKSNFSWSGMIFYFYRQSKHLTHSLFFGKNRWQRTKFRLIGIWDGILGVTGKTLDPITLLRKV